MEEDIRIQLQKLANELTKYSELEESEVGEACNLLIQIVDYPNYISDEFKQALKKEMKAQLLNFERNCIIVTKKVKSIRTIKTLEWDC